MKILSTLSLLLISSTIFGATTIKGLDYVSNSASEGRLVIKVEGNLKDNPAISVKDRSVYLNIPNAQVHPKIDRKVTINDQFDTQMSASQGAEGIVNFRANLPFSLKGKESQVNIMLKDNSIEILFPKNAKVVSQNKALKKSNENQANAQIEAVAEHLDESYLAKIEAENKAKEPAVVAEKSDGVTLAQSATAKGADSAPISVPASANETAQSEKAFNSEANESKSQFSVMGYIGKFVAFLSLLLLVFYGVLQLFKKGIIKKTNLGFLNSTKLVEVLSTTHVAPKRSLMMVRAHKQVFLVASSETGIQYLSEIKDVAGLFKEGEKALAGTNFDSEFSSAERVEKEFKMKEEVSSDDMNRYGTLDDLLDEVEVAPVQSTPKATPKAVNSAYGASNRPNRGNNANRDSLEAGRSLAKSIDRENDKDQVRLSDQIKTKLRGLKQLQ